MSKIVKALKNVCRCRHFSFFQQTGSQTLVCGAHNTESFAVAGVLRGGVGTVRASTVSVVVVVIAAPATAAYHAARARRGTRRISLRTC